MPTIQRWGNSLAVRIPAAVADQLDFRAGTPVEVLAKDGTFVVRPKSRPKYRLKDLLKNCKPGQLHDEVDFAEDVGREVLG